MPWTAANMRTVSRRDPSLIIQVSNLSHKLGFLGASSLISPDISIRVNGDHRARSEPFVAVVLDLANGFSM